MNTNALYSDQSINPSKHIIYSAFVRRWVINCRERVRVNLGMKIVLSESAEYATTIL